MGYVKEEKRATLIGGRYEVIVVGGGIAGVSAALAAARHGAKVLLIEKSYLLGGLATAGLVTYYLPLCDGRGNQVTFGIAEELLRLSVQFGAEECLGRAWLQDGAEEERQRDRFQVRFSANLFALLLEKSLKEAGVTVLLGTSVVSATVEGEAITSLITENINGRRAYLARNYIDATGDAVLFSLTKSDTHVFNQGNILASWYYEQVGGEYRLRPLGAADIPDKYKQEGAKDKRTRFTGLDADELSELTARAHAAILEDFLKRGGVDATHALATLPTVPQVRMTKRIEGLYTMDDTEVYKHFEDSVGLIGDWRKRGPVYELPYRTLVGQKICNLGACGRCISVTDAMWDITRVIPCCALSGQVIGTAAAEFADLHVASVAALQEYLHRDGVKTEMKGR